jgi:hypothetical protein
LRIIYDKCKIPFCSIHRSSNSQNNASDSF